MTTLKLFDSISLKTDVLPKLGFGLFWLVLFVASLGAGRNAYAAVQCDKTITANVVVLDNPTTFNRLGAQNPNWITYALERDVVYVDWGSFDPVTKTYSSDHMKPITKLNKTPAELKGKVELRPDKRPRPLVIRSVAGQCLTVKFTNLLAPIANPNNAQQGAGTPGTLEPALVPFPGLENNDQVAGRCAGFHATGTELVNGMEDDASMVGANAGADTGPTDAGQSNCGVGLAAPGESRTYELYTPHEGAFIIHSYGATIGSEANSGNLAVGMFGALNVQPRDARLYRSQITEEELRLATVGEVEGDCTWEYDGYGNKMDPVGTHGVTCNPGGQPIIDYEAVYPNKEPWISEGKAGLPVISMVCTADVLSRPDANCTPGELLHSDINAIIAGPDEDGSWRSKCPGDECPYPLESVGKSNPQIPDRLFAFREHTSQFHDEQTNSQVFPNWYGNPVMQHVLHGVKDQFMINYGSGGIGSEIISNRLRTGPMHDCTDCAYEEFFLASQTVGDPALLVNFPANTGIEACSPENIAAGPADPNACWRDANLGNGPIPGNFALYQEDPSNVHHSYTGDHTKYRNTHAGSFEQHIFHFHNHQWLFNPNDDNANYLDAQEIMPGSGHTYELVNGGSGNRNHTVGDAIFHCHFYPHFAQGMWYHQRNHDVFESGTVLAVSTTVGDHNGDYDADGDGFHDRPFALRSGQPAKGARAYPDGELPDGSPIPAVLPVPGKAMPQMPAAGVQVMAVDRGAFTLLGGRVGPDGIPDSSQVVIDRTTVAGADGELGTMDDVTPGYPFWLAGNECGPDVGTPIDGVLKGGACPQGIVGQRMPTPPLDMLTDAGAEANADNPFPGEVNWANLGGGWDGGLPRHALLGYTAGGLSLDTQNRLDFRKIIELAQPVYFPETGTDLERVSMRYQAVRHRPSVANLLAANKHAVEAGSFVLNGSPPVPGGPFNDPCVDDRGVLLRAGIPGHWFDGDLTKKGDPDEYGNARDGDRWDTLNTRGVSTFDAENPRTYKLANLQIDAVFNKVGYHYPQERIIILWEDVEPTILKERPPEPLVMRFNTFDCGKILHANLVPHEFELDDFQVRTPTDIIGQHIHLPKWDLTTNDGAANGWNYEDGALAPGIVEERILSINKFNKFAGTVVGPNCTLEAALEGNTTACPIPGQLAPIDLTDLDPVPTIHTGDPGSSTVAGQTELVAKPHPFFGNGIAGQHYTGARTVIQRILVDPVVNVAGVDRGLGLTFSHDHYGPSTFQQIGLYSTILAEPAGSTWVHNESGEPLNDYTMRHDGGPTSWQAAILTPNSAPVGSTVRSEEIPHHREFYFEMSDFQHAYEKDIFVGADAFGVPQLAEIVQTNGPFDATAAEVAAPAAAAGMDDPRTSWLFAVNPTLKLTANGGAPVGTFPDTVNAHPGCPGRLGQNDANIPRPCAEAINIGHSSMWVVNYRNEPVGLRVFDPNAIGPDGKKGTQAAGLAGDLAFALSSNVERAIPQLNEIVGDMPYPVFESFNDAPIDPSMMDKAKASYCDGINCDRRPGDPITPIMRAYERDHVKVKIQVGATEEQHQTTIHGLKWLSNGSGFGRGPNSGWRNFQSHGISEQFSLQVPVTTVPDQPGDVHEYLYAQDATRDGMWTGTWGILRAYRDADQNLFQLPGSGANGEKGNPAGASRIRNADKFNGVCPKFAPDGTTPTPVASFDVSAVLANDVLRNNLGVTINANSSIKAGVDGELGTEDDVVVKGDSDGDGVGDNVGGPLNTAGGTLVYNRRGTIVPSVVGEGGATIFGGTGPLNDPTAMMYVMTADLEPLAGWEDDPNCQEPDRDGVMVASKDPAALASCPVKLKDTAPVEPIVLRANAGDCIEVTLRNRLPDVAPDLAGWLDTFWVVNRDLFQPQNVADRGVDALGNPQMSFFGNNLIRPSSYVGLHPQLVAYDINRHDGTMVGGTDDAGEEMQLAPPGGIKTYRWYAGDLQFINQGEPIVERQGNGRNAQERTFVPVDAVATPVEFGGVNLLSADRIKQPQKGLFGALVIEPQGAQYSVDTTVPDGQGEGDATRATRAQMTIDAGAPGDALTNGKYRETVLMSHKLTNLRWKDGSAIKNVNQAEFGVEGAEDSGHAGFNYGMEPSWFRFKLPPEGNYSAIPNPQAMYANELVAAEPNAIPLIPGVSQAGDPQTPVFITKPDATNPVFDTRMFVLNGASADRDSTYVLHGHVWQRDPHVCVGDSQDYDLDEDPEDQLVQFLEGRCGNDVAVPSQALGLNPQAKYMGGEEGMGHVYAHWPILVDAGGTGAVPGDYLFRDYAPNGNRNGMFGILRATYVDPVPPVAEPPPEPPPEPPKMCKWNETIPETDPACKKPRRR